jgi:D-aminopeptidase
MVRPFALVVLLAAGAPAGGQERPRVRDLGAAPGVLQPGPLNAITDVEGVRVGHRTLIRGDGVRTGVTAILPHGGNLFQEKVPAAVWVINAFGKAAGFLQVRELGSLETPVVLTNTLAVGTAVQEVVRWTLEQPGSEEVRSVNAVVGETNDGFLNDIRSLPVTAADVRAAIAAAEGGSVDEGSVGAGTGTRALGWKGGIGTASRRLPPRLGGHTVGALVQSNFGGILAIDGVPVGEALGRHDFHDLLASGEAGDGSVMIVLATDAPLSPRALERLARRSTAALGRVGSYVGHGSGDFVVAFSTAYRLPHAPSERTRAVELLLDDALDPLFLGAVEAVEEAIYNSLLRATAVTGHEGRAAEALPVEEVGRLLAAAGRVEDFRPLLDFADPAGTEERLRTLLPAARQSGDPGTLAELLTQIARTHSRRGDFDAAHRILDEVEPLLSDERPRASIRYRLERGRTWNLAEERKEQALELFREAFDLAQRTGAEDLAIDAAHMIALAEPLFEGQLEWTRKALSIAEAATYSEARRWVGSLTTNLGWTYFDHGDYPAALASFERALVHRESHDEPEAVRRARWSVGRAYRALGRFEEALALQEELLAEYESRELPVYGYVYEELAELHHRNGDTRAATYFRLAYEALAQDVWMVNSQPDRLARLEELGER